MSELKPLWRVFDIANKANELTLLEEKSVQPDFWNDPAAAQTTMQQLAKLRNEVEKWQGTLQQLQDTLELVAMDDADFASELEAETAKLEKVVEKLAFRAMLGGPYDNEHAILAIHAGAGGTDAQDWAQMLMRMYIRWAEEKGHKVEVVDEMSGEEAGLKSAMISIHGEWAYGYLQSERGVHRLVRISPFNANSKRQTSFALVEVWPDIQGEVEIEINEKDLQIDTYRSSGAGGQHVQKNDTAVRITHLPTGLVVSCQNERSQVQNMNRAMHVLKSRLLALEQQKQEAEFAQLKGEHVSAEWGHQIRSYVLHPYQLVKDLRTDYETGRTADVLNGRLDEFMEAYLRYKVGS